MGHLLEQEACRDLMTWVGVDLLMMTSLFEVIHFLQSIPKAEVLVGQHSHSNLMDEVLLGHLCQSNLKDELGLHLLSLHSVDLGGGPQNNTYQHPIMYDHRHHK